MKSELVAAISTAKADSKESTDSTKDPETDPNLVLIEVTSSLVASISAVNADDNASSPAILAAFSVEISCEISPSKAVTSELVSAISADNNPSTLVKSELVATISVEIAELILTKSALVARISEFKSKITAAKALSLVVSTELIKLTISTNVSLSASAAFKIASILPASESMFPCRTPSAPSALPFSVAIASVKEVTSPFVAKISAAKPSSKASIDADTLASKTVNSSPTYFAMSDVFAISKLVGAAQFTVLKKSLICFERICAILLYLLYFGLTTLLSLVIYISQCILHLYHIMR